MTSSYKLIRRIIKGARRVKRIELALFDLIQKVQHMADQLDEVIVQETAEGDSITKLVALTDAIFAKLSAGPPSNDPRVQQVLDMIAANKKQADDAVGRDTPPA